MPKNWQRTKMHEQCEITSSKRVYASDYQSDGIPFYRSKEIIEKYNGNIDVSTELFISNSKYETFKSKFGAPEEGDLLLTSVGTLGIPYIVKKNEIFYFKDGNLTWFKKFNKLHSRFLYFWLLSPNGKAELRKCTIGSSQSAFTIVLLKDMLIDLPSETLQHKIASILSAYDDLIENNLKRIKILEEMAQMIYREWFVNFRFPGHEKVKMVDSSLGKIPEGWEVKPLRELVSNYIGGGWGKEEQDDQHTEEAYVIRGTDIPNARKGDVTDCPCRFHKASNLKSRKLQPNDIVLEVSGGSKEQPVGRNILIDEEILSQLPFPVMCASFCKLVRVSERFSSYYIDQHIRDMYESEEILKYQTQSTGISNFKFEFFLDDVKIAVPNDEILETFDDSLGSMYQSICKLGRKNTNLRKTRDLLLPKLISGELDVEGLEIKISEEVN